MARCCSSFRSNTYAIFECHVARPVIHKDNPLSGLAILVHFQFLRDTRRGFNKKSMHDYNRAARKFQTNRASFVLPKHHGISSKAESKVTTTLHTVGSP